MGIRRPQIILSILLILILAMYTLIPLKGNAFAQESKATGTEIPVEATASIDKNEVMIGDAIKFTICVICKNDTIIQFPEIEQNAGLFAVKDTGREARREKDGCLILERDYEISSYEIGHQTMPSFKIKYKSAQGEGTVDTNEVTINVIGVIKEGENPTDIKDIIPPMDVPTDFKRLIVWSCMGLGGLLLSGIGCWLIIKVRKGRTKRHQLFTIKRAPHEIAYELLEKLSKEDLISRGMIKEYYYRITNILRHYIENRFGLLAPERTTEEFLKEMAQTNILEDTHKSLISEFLEHCDMVKYAKYGPSKNEVTETFNSARRLIDETKESFEGREVLVK
jgi:hypothetical protein